MKRTAATDIVLKGWLTLVALALLAGCSSSPTSATGTASIASVVVNPSSFAVGATAQGIVTLAALAPTGGTTLSLASSNTAVVTVTTPVTVQAGALTASITVTAVGPGTAVVTASANGSSQSSQTITVTAAPALTVASVTAAPTTAASGNSVTGTVTISGPAPSGGTLVALTSSGPVTVNASVMVPATLTTATFAILTQTVQSATTATVTATLGGVSMSTTLSVTPASPAIANFGVSGPSVTETCNLTDNGATVQCTFNGSTSTSSAGTIVEWDWTYGGITASTFSQTSASAVLTNPPVSPSCSIVPAAPLPAGSPGWFTMIVTLVVKDNHGNVSAPQVDNGVRLFPQGSCGF